MGMMNGKALKMFKKGAEMGINGIMELEVSKPGLRPRASHVIIAVSHGLLKSPLPLRSGLATAKLN